MFLWAILVSCLLGHPVLAWCTLPPPSNLTVVETGEGWARLRWNTVDDPTLQGYRLKYSLAEGFHPSMLDWNGYEAAFCLTTDDGFDENMIWMKVCDRHACPMTAFVIPARFGQAGSVTAAEIETLHAHGHEIAAHSYNHVPLVRNTAFTIRYVGPGSCCFLEIDDDTLKTVLDSCVVDLKYALNDPSVCFVGDLVDSIDANPSYDCALDYYRCTYSYCYSISLCHTGPVEIGEEPCQVLTHAGCDSLALRYEVTSSKAFLEELVSDTAYRCLTMAYPYHAHDQREMNAAMEAEYIGARNGSTAEGCPGHCTGSLSYLNCVNIYQKPVTWGRTPNDSAEAWCRQRIRNRVSAWKASNEWATFGAIHTLADWDSAHVDWALDEITNDGGVWVASFGEICQYVRQFHVTVEDPVEAWNDSATASAVLGELPAGPWVYVVVVAYDTCDVESGWSNEVALVAQACQSAVGSASERTLRWCTLGRPRPQPANSGVRLPLWIELPGIVDVRLHDIRGRLVGVLFKGQLPSGNHEVYWNGLDASGSPLPSGLYFCRLSSPYGSATERILLIR